MRLEVFGQFLNPTEATSTELLQASSCRVFNDMSKERASFLEPRRFRSTHIAEKSGFEREDVVRPVVCSLPGLEGYPPQSLPPPLIRLSSCLCAG
jgi:hypothetical protein